MGDSAEGGAGDGESLRTLWVGDLAYWMDESYLSSAFSGAGGDVVKTKVMRNKQTGQSEGYGFVEFGTREAAERAISSLNGTMMPSSQQLFRINWASFGIGARRPEGSALETSNEFSLFVGDLAPEINDLVLLDTFRSHFGSARAAKVVTDPSSGRSKGFGFVRFGSEAERDRALTDMNGAYCGSRPMRISLATPKKPGGAPGGPVGYGAAPAPSPGYSGEDAANTTIFVGGLDSAVGEEELRRSFAYFGDLVYVKVPPGKGCGFVQFVHRTQAEHALNQMNGRVIGKQPVRLSWGRSGRGGGPPPPPQQQHVHPGYAGYPGYSGYAGYPMYPYPPAYGFVDPTYMGYAYAAAGMPPEAYAQGMVLAGHSAAAGVAHMSRGPEGPSIPPNAKPDLRMLNMINREAVAPMMMGANMLLRPPPPYPKGGGRRGA